jgi:hypothetical protein
MAFIEGGYQSRFELSRRFLARVRCRDAFKPDLQRAGIFEPPRAALARLRVRQRSLPQARVHHSITCKVAQNR